MKSVDRSPHPVQTGLPSEEDFGFGLGASSADLGIPRPWIKVGQVTVVWLFWCALLAACSLYYVVGGDESTRLLGWTAAGAAVVLLLGAGLIRSLQADAAHLSPRASSFLHLAAFVVPLGQFLFAMVHTQDAGSTVLILLIVIGYSIIAPSAESLLAFLTFTLATWAACIVRFPSGTWQNYVVPWFGAVALAMWVQQLRGKERLLALWSAVRKPSAPCLDISQEEQLREVRAARDELRTRCAQLEEQLHRPASGETRWEEDLFFLQESARDLARDVTLDEIGAGWLERLRHRLGAKQASLWLSRAGEDFKLALGLSECGPDDAMSILSRTATGGQLLQTGDRWSLPLDLGLHGRGVLLLQGTPHAPSASATKLLHVAGAALTLFLRWQIADAENEALTQQVHEVHENHHRAHEDWQSQDATHRSLSEQLKQQLQTTQTELEQLRLASSTDATRWKTEAEKARQLLEQALGEHDTLSQLLSETEMEVKRLKAEAKSSSDLRERLRQAEQDSATATAGWQQVEEQLRQAESARQRAEVEARDAVEEWHRETTAVSRLTHALRTIDQAVAVFDTAGQALFENEAAQALRGSLRNRPGEHPLWQPVTPDTLTAIRRDGQWQGEVDVSAPGQNGQAYHVTVKSTGSDPTREFIITARSAQEEVQRRQQLEEIEAARIKAAQSGSRFFAGLVRTLEPPVSSLIEHAESLLEHPVDPDVQRQHLLALLRHTRRIRGFLTQAFDYAELETGEATVVKGKHSPWQLLNDVVHRHRVAAEERGVALSITPTGDLPPTITTDADRLQGVLSELLGFALRSVQPGPVVIHVGLEEASPLQARLARLQINFDLSLSLDSIAEPFAESDGIGLAIARRQTVALGGELRLEKVASRACRASLLLPVTALELATLMPGHQLPLVEVEEGDVSYSPLRGRVLVVVADHETQRVVTFHLERLGLRTQVVADGTAAFERLRDEAFHAVLWDLSNKASAAVSEIRTSGYAGAILALGNLEQAGRDAFLAAGGHGVLNLPIVPAHWRQTLSALVPMDEDRELPGVESLRSEFHGDPEFLPLVERFATSLPGQVAQMRAALQVADLATLTRLVHTLTGHAHLFGYPPLASAACAVEQAILRGADSHQLSQALDLVQETLAAIDRGMKSTLSSGILTLPGPRGLAA